jgi:hypothetical protein
LDALGVKQISMKIFRQLVRRRYAFPAFRRKMIITST